MALKTEVLERFDKVILQPMRDELHKAVNGTNSYRMRNMAQKLEDALDTREEFARILTSLGY